MFPWKDTYRRAVERSDNPEYEIGYRSGQYEKVKGYEVLETGKNGYYLPVLPSGSEYIYATNVNDTWEKVREEDVRPFLPKEREPASGIVFRSLMVDKIYKLTGGGGVWLNPNFEYKYIGVGA